jgi:cephalosporin hydroxylase
MVQVPEEIEALASFVAELKPRNVLEIGTWKGGTFYLWCALSDPRGLKISIDLPGGAFGGDRLTPEDIRKRDDLRFPTGFDSRQTQYAYLISGDSHALRVRNRAADLLAGEKLDFLFIDGDHTYEGVKQDFLMYSPFVSPSGWIAFHDINDSEWHRQNNVGVSRLWAELKGKKLEFNSHQNWAGIGLIQGGEL